MLVQSIPYPQIVFVETGTVGQTTNDGGTSVYNLSTGDFKSVYAATVPAGGIWFKRLILRVRSANAGNHIRPVIYTGASSAATIIATGQDIAASAQAIVTAGVDVPIDFRADGAATFLPAGTIGICIHASGTGITVVGVPGSVNWNADTYSDGPASPFGTTSSSSVTPQIYIPYSVAGP